jgi:hypothetical protein
MPSWKDFERNAPRLAARGRELLFRNDAGEGMLTTVRGEEVPRTHPVNVGIVEGRLLTFVRAASPKAGDLAADGRYALHAHVDPAEPHELLIRGRAALVTDALRARAAVDWPFDPGDDYALYELRIEHVLFGERLHADAWPPRYGSWRPAAALAML